MSLNEHIDNILQILRNSNVVESEHISRIQIEKWILYYRAMLIKQKIDKDELIDEEFLTTIEPVQLTRKETVPGHFTYESDVTLPKLMNFKRRSGIINVRDMFGNIIQVGSLTKARMQKYRKATCKDYIAWVKNNKVYIEGGSNQLEYISMDVILEDPRDLGDCYNPDCEFPLPVYMTPTIVQLIMANELKTMVAMPSDESNNSHDDLQNIALKTRQQ